MPSELGPRPIVHLYTICWNEEYMLPYFFRHYDGWIDRYVFHDDGSTDRTLEILERHPRVEVRPLPRLAVDSYVLAAQQVHDNCWKESRGRADWVVVTAVDELLWAPQPHLPAYLAECRRQGVTAIPALGFQMLSPVQPRSDAPMTDLVRRGCPRVPMSKLSVFDPERIQETRQAIGRHTAEPVGVVRYPQTDVLRLLHYKYLSFDYTLKRHGELQQKLGAVDKERNWGYKYGWASDQLKAEWDELERCAVPDVFSPGYNPHLEHSPPAKRWWRRAQTQ